jgi:hypothetical protein
MSTSAIRFNARNPSLLARADGQLAHIRFNYTPTPKPTSSGCNTAPAPVQAAAPMAYVTFPFCDARWYSDRVTSYGASPAVVLYKKVHHIELHA